jgi:potassium-dependent mechanosensitive channel
MKQVGLNVLRLMLLVLALSSQSLAAQNNTDTGFDFEAWKTMAHRAEGIIKDAAASSPALETLRSDLADYRSQALALHDDNKARIDTLQSQLDALGPVPDAGIAEAPGVATRRAELVDQLAAARAPSLAAQEAYKRADGMIGEVDAIIRDRISAQLFTLGSSPLNVTLWPGALESIGSFYRDIREEVNEGLDSETQRVLTRQNLPISLSLLVVGLLLLTRARHWLLRGLGLLPAAANPSDNEARNLLVSTTQILIPMLGLWAIERAIVSTGLMGLRGAVVLDALPWMGLCVFGAYWLGRTLFSNTDNTPVLFALNDEGAISGQRMTGLMGVMLALDLLLDRIAIQADFPETAHIVLSFPIVLVTGFLLVRMGLLLDPAKAIVPSEAEQNPLQNRVYRMLTRAIILLGVAGPVLAAIGYFTASTSFVFPAVRTLALLGTLLVLYRLLSSLAESLLRSSREQSVQKADERPLTLIPVALGFALILLAIPALALIWGARVSDLQEVWTLISEGFSVGDRRISATDFLTFAIVFVAGYTITRLLQSSLRTTVLPRTSLDSGGRNAVLSGTGYVGIFLAALAAFTSAGLDLSSLAIVAGALSLGIGFGLQAIVSNFVSGIILLVERPIKEGDWIEVGSYSGYVQKISVRSTEIETFDRATVVVPNADFISGTVTNWTHSNMNGRVKVPVGVAYDSDPEQVRTILLEIAEAHEMVDHRFNTSVVFMGFGADSMDFEVRVILKDVNYVLSVKSDMNYEIVRRFREAGIEIPFAQRDINLRNLDELGAVLKKNLGDKK